MAQQFFQINVYLHLFRSINIQKKLQKYKFLYSELRISKIKQSKSSLLSNQSNRYKKRCHTHIQIHLYFFTNQELSLKQCRFQLTHIINNQIMENPTIDPSNQQKARQEIPIEKESAIRDPKEKCEQQEIYQFFVFLYSRIQVGTLENQKENLDQIFKQVIKGSQKLNNSFMLQSFSYWFRADMLYAGNLALKYEGERHEYIKQLQAEYNAFGYKKNQNKKRGKKELKQQIQVSEFQLKCLKKIGQCLDNIKPTMIQLIFREFSKRLWHYKEIYKWAIIHNCLDSRTEDQCKCKFGTIIDQVLSKCKKVMFEQKYAASFDKIFRLGTQYLCFICGVKKNSINLQLEANLLQQQIQNPQQKLEPQIDTQISLTPSEADSIDKQDRQKCSTASNISQVCQLQQNSSIKSNSEEEQDEQQFQKLLSFIENIQIQQENRKQCCVTDQWIQQINRKSKAQLRRARKSKKNKKN